MAEVSQYTWIQPKHDYGQDLHLNVTMYVKAMTFIKLLIACLMASTTRLAALFECPNANNYTIKLQWNDDPEVNRALV